MNARRVSGSLAGLFFVFGTTAIRVPSALARTPAQPTAPAARSSTPGVTLDLEETGRRKIEDGWPTGRPDFLVTGMSAPKGRLERALFERARQLQGQSAGSVVTYRARTSGFPLGKIFTLWLESAGLEPVAASTGWIADPTGAIVCGDTGPSGARTPPGVATCASQFRAGIPLADVTFGASRHSPGESFRVALTATDGTVRAYAAALPFPLERTSGGCRVWLERLEDPARHAFAARGEGFHPGETVRFASRVGKEAVSESLPVEAHGTLKPFVYAPGPKKKRGGLATVTFEGRSCRCELTVPWGDALQPQ